MGRLLADMDKMEKDLYGQTSSGSVMSRVDRVYNRLEGTPSGTQLSIAAQMNAIEWQFADRMSDEGVKTESGTLKRTCLGLSTRRIQFCPACPPYKERLPLRRSFPSNRDAAEGFPYQDQIHGRHQQ